MHVLACCTYKGYNTDSTMHDSDTAGAPSAAATAKPAACLPAQAASQQSSDCEAPQVLPEPADSAQQPVDTACLRCEVPTLHAGPCHSAAASKQPASTSLDNSRLQVKAALEVDPEMKAAEQSMASASPVLAGAVVCEDGAGDAAQHCGPDPIAASQKDTAPTVLLAKADHSNPQQRRTESAAEVSAAGSTGLAVQAAGDVHDVLLAKPGRKRKDAVQCDDSEVPKAAHSPFNPSPSFSKLQVIAPALLPVS